mmetsp:Transcript_20940/g.45665  ORF Transcript_20940/g.45665 Transcript_20940/m.45665 type:complete len:230 (-) Transcript_20940:179-868(-)|eukprot:CAMPEP_0178525594 /NCGR_PEP_ID=MMETSP0696-20121128/30264_1 /TAXON_ID=265572 /ORGANISM="Extubocellulus spinifer, Strain CCMP396" /LENGTH=229 /DNA_ID=CAMNT_0020157015 /DNA_START=326 /DNA_END=1015 /DNA_ORIENTATION=+
MITPTTATTLALSVLVVVSASAGAESSALRRRLQTPSSAPTTFEAYLAGCDPPLFVDHRKYWTDLTTKQRCAAIRVGYTEDTWNNDGDPNKNLCSSTCSPSPATSNIDAYEMEGWDDLTAVSGCGNLQEQFKVLGYTEGSWEDFYYCYSWGDLVQAGMKESAQALGYSRNIWNNCLEDVCIEGVEDQDWADLATGVQTAAGAFGFECFTWDGYADPTENWWVDITCPEE